MTAIDPRLQIVKKEEGYAIVSPTGENLGVITDPNAARAIQYALMNLIKPLRGYFPTVGRLDGREIPSLEEQPTVEEYIPTINMINDVQSK